MLLYYYNIKQEPGQGANVKTKRNLFIELGAVC